MFAFPSLAELPPEQRVQGLVGMRYEDMAQDGALKVGAMPHALGKLGYRKLWHENSMARDARRAGVLAILSRLVLQAAGGPISAVNAVEVEAGYRLGHTRAADGSVARILMNMSAELFGPKARLHGQVQGAGERVHVGRVFAEHVFTRPFGPPEQRKVLTLDRGGQPFVPPDEVPFEDALSLLTLPSLARPLEADFALDPCPLVFGLTHTDANQHVNSLVYPQLFEDAALRRAAELGHDTRALLVDHIDLSFRKPCFAGQRMRLSARAFEREGRLGVVAYIAPEGAPLARAHCTCALTLRDGELPR